MADEDPDRRAEGADAEFIGPAPSRDLGFPTLKDVTGPAGASRVLTEALHERGVAQG